MGIIIGKFRKKKSTYDILEKLDNEIESIEEFGRSTELYRKKVIGRFILIAILIYFILACLMYYYYNEISSNKKLIYTIPLVAFPFIVVIIKKFLAWYYAKKLQRNEKKLIKLREEKKKILDNVMETETYKVAKKILDKFGNEPKKPVLEVTPTTNIVARSNQSGLRQRNWASNQLPKGRLSFGTPRAPGFVEQPSASTLSYQSRALPQPNSALGPSRSTTLVGTPALGMASRTPAPVAPLGTHLTLPRSILPASRSVLDKMVDYLVGDGPSNRYALICKKCFFHNGMAVKEEFEYLSFRCCYCSHFNPAPKMKPTGPKFGSTQNLQIEPADDSSDNDTQDSESETIPLQVESLDARRSSSEIETPKNEVPKESTRDSNSSPEPEKYSDFDKLSDIESKEGDATDKSSQEETIGSTNIVSQKVDFDDIPMEIDQENSVAELINDKA